MRPVFWALPATSPVRKTWVQTTQAVPQDGGGATVMTSTTIPERVLDEAESVIRLVREHARQPIPGFNPTVAIRHVAENLRRIDGFTSPMRDLLGQETREAQQTNG